MRVVIAEDHALLRDGLARILGANGIEVVAALDEPSTLTAVVANERPDLAILDVRMPPTYTNEGLVAAIDARRAVPGFPMLVLSQYVEQLYARELLASGDGALGYLLKDRVMEVPEFIAAVRQVAAGGTVLDPKVVAAMLSSQGARSPVADLTPRELEVLGLMAEGRANRGIADVLVITERAVGKHINNIFAKLGLPVDAAGHRRVLAVLEYLQSAS